MKSRLLKHIFFYFLSVTTICGQTQKIKYTHADTLKGTISKERSWWDVGHYDLHVSFNDVDSSIVGYNTILYKVLQPYSVMQIDLMQPMQIDSILHDGKNCFWKRDGNAFFVTLFTPQNKNEQKQITIYFHGKPRAAKLPPWDGGVIWSKDKNGNPWISIACQGMAAGVWFPNKDHQYDEVDSTSVFITAISDLVTVSNGRLRSKKINPNKTSTYNWVVVNPINNYNIIPYIGKYANFKDTFYGKGGLLDLDFWVLEGNAEKAKKQFVQVKPMLRCFEDWFGKYPFYEDGYKLVEAPFLGMEHQSAVAYGNKFQNGYLGRDLSLTGWGLKWDFIIVHESGHEWFGNNITAKDVADNWIHEGFTAYAENLFVESLYGKKAGSEYVIGTRIGIQNDEPIIADYNVNTDGSGDMYYKAANMLHTIRQIVENDTLWKGCLKNMNKLFWHQTVSTKQIETYLVTYLKLDLQKVFDQYLRTNQIPVLEYKLSKHKVEYRWTNCVENFDMPLKLLLEKDVWIYPQKQWQSLSLTNANFLVDDNFYIKTKQVK
jgi:aminopeptidase N